MVLTLNRHRINFPNTLANLLVLISSLGVSIFGNIRIGLVILTGGLFIFFLPSIKFNKLTISSYFLIALNAYFFIDAYILESPSSLYLFKDFVYLILFDLLLKYRMKHSKSVYLIAFCGSILSIFLNQIFQDSIIGVFSPAFGIPRIISVSTVMLSLFLLFKYVGLFEKLFILFATLITFSMASYVLYLLYLLKKIPVLLISGLILLILNFNFEENELYMLIKQQKEKSIENKVNDSKSSVNTVGEYEIAEVLSIELYQNSGIVFSILVTFFLTFYIYIISRSCLFTAFSWIILSSNPMPLILILIIANLLNISNNENKEYS
jgi:hypothetical protein